MLLKGLLFCRLEESFILKKISICMNHLLTSAGHRLLATATMRHGPLPGACTKQS